MSLTKAYDSKHTRGVLTYYIGQKRGKPELLRSNNSQKRERPTRIAHHQSEEDYTSDMEKIGKYIARITTITTPPTTTIRTGSSMPNMLEMVASSFFS
jgi:hypothetical protein